MITSTMTAHFRVCPEGSHQAARTGESQGWAASSGNSGSRSWNNEEWPSSYPPSGVNSSDAGSQGQPVVPYASERSVPGFPTLPPTSSRDALHLDTRPADLTRRPRLNGLNSCSYLCVHSDRELVNGTTWASTSDGRTGTLQHWYTCCKPGCLRLRPEIRGSYCCIKCVDDAGHSPDCDCCEMILGNMPLPQTTDHPSGHQVITAHYMSVRNELLPEPPDQAIFEQRCNCAVYNMDFVHNCCKVPEPGMPGMLREGPAQCELRARHAGNCICTRCRQEIVHGMSMPERAARITQQEALHAGRLIGTKFCTQKCECNRLWNHPLCCGGQEGGILGWQDGSNTCCYMDNHEPFRPHRCALCRYHKPGADYYLQPWVTRSTVENSTM